MQIHVCSRYASRCAAPPPDHGPAPRDIVATVVELARDCGPDAITTQAIADRRGLTHGAVFRHFPDKQAIWTAVFDWVREASAR